MNSVRGRLTLLVLAVLAAVLGTAGYALDRQISSAERSAFDTRLERTLRLSEPTATAAVLEALPEGDSRLDAVLEADNSTLRLTLAGRALFETGAEPPGGLPKELPNGLSTITIGDGSYRSLSTKLGDADLSSLARLEIVASLAPLERRESARRVRIIVVLASTLLLAALGTYLAAGFVLRPLGRLRRSAHQIALSGDLTHRVPEQTGPTETKALGRSFNAMLSRLQESAQGRERALAATRRFTADAGHELRTPMTSLAATLSLLGRSDIDEAQRAQLAADAQREQARLVALLDGLSALARGDAGPAEHQQFDIADLADEVVATSAPRYPSAVIEGVLPDGAMEVTGWEPGLRMVIENLVRNAVIHGGDEPHVRVTVQGGAHTKVTVEDDGPGVAEADRKRIFEPFARAGAGDAPGSGLGLALVAQQVQLHRGTIVVDKSPELGGARFTITLGSAS